MTDENGVQIAFGPVGGAGLVLCSSACSAARPGSRPAGALAVAADVTLPQLRGFAALHGK